MVFIRQIPFFQYFLFHTGIILISCHKLISRDILGTNALINRGPEVIDSQYRGL